MAVRLDNTSDSLKRTANLPSIGVGATAMAWFYRAVDRDAIENCIAFEDSGGAYDQIYMHGVAEAIEAWVGGGTSTGISWSTGTWKHIAMTHNGAGEWDFFVDGVEVISNLADTLSDFSVIWFGNDRDSELFNGRVAFARVWDIALTPEQVADEMRTAQPRNAVASLNFYWPLINHSNAIDYGPNARDPTVGGTLATEDGPPIAWRHAGMRRYYKPAAAGGTKAPPPFHRPTRTWTRRY